VSGAITEVILITKCCPKKTTKNKPERAIIIFLAMDDEGIPLMFLKILRANLQHGGGYNKL
jgi:uncharacterized protein with ParB-like and HNH nuclease domain